MDVPAVAGQLLSAPAAAAAGAGVREPAIRGARGERGVLLAPAAVIVPGLVRAEPAGLCLCPQGRPVRDAPPQDQRAAAGAGELLRVGAALFAREARPDFVAVPALPAVR